MSSPSERAGWPSSPVAVLCGGVGAARYLSGLLQVLPAEVVTAIVNTGDDVTMHGLRICPDIDTITYTLAGEVNPETGWGLVGETWQAMEALAGLGAAAPEASGAGATWFGLGDRDLATHLYRTQRLAEGAGLAAVTAELARARGLELELLPVTEDRLATRVTVVDEGEIGFQDYFVRRRHDVTVTGVRFDGAETADPGPGVLAALEAAERIVVAPSNPIVSIGPVLAVAEVAALLAARRDRVVAVSPIVAGAAVKGPAARLMVELGHDASVVGVARLLAPVAATLVVDTADADLAAEVERAGMGCVVAPSLMTGPDQAAALARATLAV